MNEKRKTGITDTSLRDAHQSLLATRMRLEDMLPVAELMDEVGYHSLEVWGGATFDACMRFLDEDPWERLRRLRQAFRKTRLQMLLRGQNIVGYRHYADDVLEEFIKRTVANGIDIIRIFDALNDLRNMEQAMRYTRAEGAHVQGTISYTISPLHNIDHFVAMGRQLKELGADSICIKDMAGLIAPYDAYDLVRGLKEQVGLPVQLHCHYTSGMASMAYLKAVEAGVDVVDTANAALSLGSSQPPTDSVVAALQGTPYDTGLDLEILARVSDHFKAVAQKFSIPREIIMGVDTNVLSYQIPGGMISNLASQLAEQKALHRMREVLEEVPRVRADLGYPPLVTPSSQIVGTQAVVNVLLGERYKMVSTEIKNYLRGLYGRPPGQINEAVLKKVLKDEAPVTVRPADLLKPQLAEARREIAGLMMQEEDVLSYAIFPNVALDFFKRRQGLLPPLPREGEPAGQAPPKGNPAAAAVGPDLSALYRVDLSLAWFDGVHMIYPA
jgi:oxaloacetate decarboxylase alpha subunit